MRAAVLVSLLLPLAAAAADCHTAQEAYVAGDYATALSQWRELAEDNHAHSQLMIGALYFNGQGVEQDYAEAARWFRQAADNGSADAALQLVQMYSSGEGVTRDAGQAQRWRSRAAELAQHDSIECHRVSRGGERK